ncbi:hypothetical protein SAMN05444266_102299 [Chitinophaga jiangningensis]|uniref:Uncharacterized protein n=1 Tax=Chitinophaga jiangningensis TaxID=1419482 RepID=A0A1M6YFT2_9BACT|nr:hypothetical protein SAMN05444266_102299 [Chitinophaga jiangningensis]
MDKTGEKLKKPLLKAAPKMFRIYNSVIRSRGILKALKSRKKYCTFSPDMPLNEY